MKLVTVDVETTIFEKGNPFSQKNKLVAIGVKIDSNPVELYFADENGTFEESVIYLQNLFLESENTIVGVNLKFDLNWLQRYGIYDTNSNCRFWDCQLVDFVMACQQTPFPSLDSIAAKYDLGSKFSNIHENYWSKGIDTDAIPREELSEYLRQDLELTYAVACRQQAALPPEQRRLVSLMNQDLAVLQQMEYNGLYFDVDNAKTQAQESKREVFETETKLRELLNIGFDINWNSHEELSAALYGGTIVREKKVQFGFFKTGKRAGQPKFKTVEYKIELPRLIMPLDGTELQKEGYWQTDAITFQKIKTNKKTREIVNLLLRRAELTKLVSTYLEALPQLIERRDWKDNLIHGRFNQCVARTGRLSSSEPNLQNMSEGVKQFIRSRYERSN